MKVFVVGVTPPPFGGVSIHVKRFAEYCWANSEKYTLGVFDYKKREISLRENKGGLFQALLFWATSRIVHVHMSGGLKVLVILVSKIFRKKVVYTHHNSIISDGFVFRIVCKLCDTVILVNSEKIFNEIKSKIDRLNVFEIPAFIPPENTEPLPSKLADKFLKYDRVISTNCSSASSLNGEEVYGISRIVKVFIELSTRGCLENSALAVCDPSGSYRDRFDWLALEVLSNGNGIIYWGEPVDFSEVIKRSNVTVRPTITDGDSISVRESLYFRTPIVASDCVTRPKGVLLYRTLDDADLADKLVAANEINSCEFGNPPNYANDIVGVYDRLSAI